MRKYALERTANSTFYHYLQNKVPGELLGISCHGFAPTSSSGTFVHQEQKCSSRHRAETEARASGHRMEMVKLQCLTQKGLTTLQTVAVHAKPMWVRGVAPSKTPTYLHICFI